MKWNAKNAIVLVIVIAAATVSLSAPISTTQNNFQTMLPGRSSSWPVTILIGFGSFCAVIGACVIFKHLVKVNANLVGTILIAAGAATITASIAVMIYSRAEDRGAAVFSEHTALALITQIEQIGTNPNSIDMPTYDDNATLDTTISSDSEDLLETRPILEEEPKSLMIDGADYI